MFKTKASPVHVAHLVVEIVTVLRDKHINVLHYLQHIQTLATTMKKLLEVKQRVKINNTLEIAKRKSLGETIICNLDDAYVRHKRLLFNLSIFSAHYPLETTNIISYVIF